MLDFSDRCCRPNALYTPAKIKHYALGDLLDASIRLYRSAFVPFVLIAALVVLPSMLLAIGAIAVSSALAGDSSALENGAGIFDELGPLGVLAGAWALGQRRPSGLEQLISFVATPIMQGALIYAASRRMDGAAVSATPAYREALRRAWPLIGAQLLTVVLVVVPLLPLACLGLVAVTLFDTAPPAGETSSLVIAVGFVLLLVVPLLLFFTTRLAFVQQAAMLEENGPWQSIKRSWRLTAGSFWRVLGYTVVIGLLGSIVAIVIPLTLSLPLRLFAADIAWLMNVVDAVGDALASMVVAPFTAIAYTLLFYDLYDRGTHQEQPGA